MNNVDWDAEAADFDKAADHGLLDPHVRGRWRSLLLDILPRSGRVLDIGCGTGTLSILLAESGFEVTGIDASDAMVELARDKAKASDQRVTFEVQDGDRPTFAPGTFDVVLGRHVVWALPSPQRDALQRWARLLGAHGHMLLIEGFWHTGAGLRLRDLMDQIPTTLRVLESRSLSADAGLWGAPQQDERYLVHAIAK